MNLLTKNQAHELVALAGKDIIIPSLNFTYRLVKGAYIGSGLVEPDEIVVLSDNTSEVNVALENIVKAMSELIVQFTDPCGEACVNTDCKITNEFYAWMFKNLLDIFTKFQKISDDGVEIDLAYKSTYEMIDAVYEMADELLIQHQRIGA